MVAKIITFVKSYWHDLFVLGCIVMISIISYNLGQIRALRKSPLGISTGANIYLAGSVPQAQEQGNIDLAQSTPRDSRVVASKNSTAKRYYFTWCATAKRIKVENQIWFENEAVAQKAGYSLGGNCQ